tara:strand:+ start:479 stop:1207 length:729 start_codon:yes stop_codon:yes gene_type:complete
MGYLDNTSITVDAILTKKGRELLAMGGIEDFNITQFALADDEVDYTMFNENHPNGTQYSGEAIENMPIIEAIPDGDNIMLHKLVTLEEGTSIIPFLAVGQGSIIRMSIGGSEIVKPRTHNYNGVIGGSAEPNGYRFTIADGRLFDLASGTGPAAASTNMTAARMSPSTTPQSYTVVGNSLSLQAKSAQALFGSYSSLTTTLTVEGLNTAARITIPITVSKKITKTSTSGDSSDTRVNPSAAV